MRSEHVVSIPTLLYHQVRADSLTDPSDVQAMFDNIPVADKQLLWIEGTTARWDGYTVFQRRPLRCSSGSTSTWPELSSEHRGDVRTDDGGLDHGVPRRKPVSRR